MSGPGSSAGELPVSASWSRAGLTRSSTEMLRAAARSESRRKVSSGIVNWGIVSSAPRRLRSAALNRPPRNHDTRPTPDHSARVVCGHHGQGILRAQPAGQGAGGLVVAVAVEVGVVLDVDVAVVDRGAAAEGFGQVDQGAAAFLAERGDRVRRVVRQIQAAGGRYRARSSGVFGRGRAPGCGGARGRRARRRRCPGPGRGRGRREHVADRRQTGRLLRRGLEYGQSGRRSTTPSLLAKSTR